MLQILLGILGGLCVILWWLTSPFYWKGRGIRYLFPLPIFGSNLRSLTMSLHDFHDSLHRVYPNEKYYGLHYFMKPTLFVKDAAIMKDICIKDFNHFSWNGMYTNENDPFSDNLFFSHGQAWKEMRANMTPLFTPFKLKIVQKYVENCMIKVDKCIENKVMINEPIQIEQLTVGVATDVIVQAIFGIETDCFEEISKFRDISKRMFSYKTNFKMLFSALSPELNKLFGWNIFEKYINEFMKNLLDDVIKYREINNTSNQDFLDALIKIKSSKEINTEDKYFPDNTRKPAYDLKTVLAQALILYAGGAESSAMTMAFLFYELSLHQDMQDKCRDEVMAVVNETGTEVKCDDINKLTYLEMVIRETMRKYPPFPLLSRKCTKTYTFPDSGLTIEPGTYILSSVKGMQWDPKYYPDPDAFIPERFADKASIDPGTYTVWGLGPKSCIGKKFAEIEMFLTISHLLKNYRFSISPTMKIPVDIHPYAAVTSPVPGIFLNVQPIN